MSNKEKCYAILDSFTENQLTEIISLLQDALDRVSENHPEPNAVTRAALEEGEQMLHDPSTLRFSSVEELFAELDSE